MTDEHANETTPEEQSVKAPASFDIRPWGLEFTSSIGGSHRIDIDGEIESGEPDRVLLMLWANLAFLKQTADAMRLVLQNTGATAQLLQAMAQAQARAMKADPMDQVGPILEMMGRNLPPEVMAQVTQATKDLRR